MTLTGSPQESLRSQGVLPEAGNRSRTTFEKSDYQTASAHMALGPVTCLPHHESSVAVPTEEQQDF